MKKICSKCKRDLPIENFKFRSDKNCYRTICRKCTNDVDRVRPSTIRNWAKYRVKQKEERKNGVNRATWILMDSRHSDKKKGFANDLDKEFINQKIGEGCFYCGENKIQIGLDRIDNCKGHIKSNVVASCIRCNVVRRDMPFGAWVCVSKGMREARESGLFDGWKIRISGKTIC